MKGSYIPIWSICRLFSTTLMELNLDNTTIISLQIDVMMDKQVELQENERYGVYIFLREIIILQ